MKTPKKKATLTDLVRTAHKEGMVVTCKLQPKDSYGEIHTKLATEAKRYCAVKLMHEAHRQTRLAVDFRLKKLESGSAACQHAAWAFHLAAAFLLASESGEARSFKDR